MDSQRLFTSWYNTKGLQCKIVGPSTKCFCDHLYKYHNTINGKLKCSTSGCKCLSFYYLPIYGSQDFKCTCKHSYQQHDVGKRNCKSCTCKSFCSNWSCTCGQKFDLHKTVSQTKQAKQSKGEVVQKNMGGVVSYSAMLDGADRFQNDINNQIKTRGIKVKVQEFIISKQPAGATSALQLYNTPLKLG